MWGPWGGRHGNEDRNDDKDDNDDDDDHDNDHDHDNDDEECKQQLLALSGPANYIIQKPWSLAHNIKQHY